MSSRSATALVEIRDSVASQAGLRDSLLGMPRDPEGFGDLVAAGPRAGEAPAAYAFVAEAIREGYLLHYDGQARLFHEPDPDLALLAGDFLYALGLDRLAGLADADAVVELSDLIATCSALHGAEPGAAAPACESLWVAVAVAVGCGSDPELARAKRLLAADPSAVAGPLGWARAKAASCGLERELEGVSDQVGFAT